MAYLRSAPTRIINATGVLLHTNVGRAPLHPDAVAAAAEAAAGYTNLEIDRDTGRRGSRLAHVTGQLTVLSGAEAALVVNNNAGALLLTLAALGSSGSVPVSRGEMIEIGGSYRLPELMAASGTRMVEVGTTNRTRVEDHARAIDTETALLLKVHPSNYRITGFTEEATLEGLVELGRAHDLPVVFDVGSGLLDAATPWLGGAPPSWLANEPGVTQAVAAGADLVLFSGDKLLGGPQAGIIVGRADLVERVRTHPMARALRIDGSTIGAMAGTLHHYLGGTAAEIPFWRMATASLDELEIRARSILDGGELDAAIGATASTIGAGSVPSVTMPSVALIIENDVDTRHAALLAASDPVLARRSEGRLIVDLRTVQPDEDDLLRRSMATACL